MVMCVDHRPPAPARGAGGAGLLLFYTPGPVCSIEGRGHLFLVDMWVSGVLALSGLTPASFIVVLFLFGL